MKTYVKGDHVTPNELKEDGWEIVAHTPLAVYWYSRGLWLRVVNDTVTEIITGGY
jgi:hypothetical protein